MNNQTPQPTTTPTVGLFVTCLVDLFRPSVGLAAVKLLEDAGYRVEAPEAQTCCSQPAFNSGDFDSAKAIAQQVIILFEHYDYVVGPSGSCMGMIKHHYPNLFKDSADWKARAEDLANKSYELTSFLVDIAKIENLESQLNVSITYHDSCAGLRELRVKQQPRQLLESIDGIDINEMQLSETCCGFGGTFCVKFPELSTRLADDKIANIETSEAEYLLGGDLGCLLHLSGRIKRENKNIKVLHVAEVLAGMTDIAGIGDGEES